MSFKFSVYTRAASVRWIALPGVALGDEILYDWLLIHVVCIRPELGPELLLSNTSELTSLLDVEARSHGAGGKRLLQMSYGCCAMALLYQAATGTGFDAAAASVVVSMMLHRCPV